MKVGELLGRGYEDLKRTRAVGARALLLIAAVAAAPWLLAHVASWLAGSDSVFMVGALASVVFDVVWLAYVSGGLVRLELAVARDQREVAAFDVVRSTRTLPLLGAAILRGGGVLLGALLAGIPAILVGIATSFAPYYVVDRGCGPADALRRSAEGTRGSRGLLFRLGLVVGLLGLGVFAAAGAMLFGADALVMRAFYFIVAHRTNHTMGPDDLATLRTLVFMVDTTIVLGAVIVVATIWRAALARAYVVLADGR